MQTQEFSKLYEVAWDQIDPLGHLRGPVVLDYAFNTQMSWITHYGYGQKELAEAGYDPIVLRLEARFHREALVGDTLRDTPMLSGLSPDGTMWRTYHEVKRTDEEKIATVRLQGTWFDWRKRQPVAPANELLQILRKVQRTSNFEEMRSIMRPSQSRA